MIEKTPLSLVDIIHAELPNVELPLNLESTLKTLSESSLCINQKIYALLESVLQRSALKGTHLIMAGSLIHGGGYVRQMMGRKESHEVDVFLVGTQQNYVQYRDFIAQLEKALSVEGKHLCETIQPQSLQIAPFAQVEDIASALYAFEAMQDVQDIIWLHPEVLRILACFQASVPFEANKKQLFLLGQALSSLNQIDSEFISSIKNLILRKWREVHRLSTKHFFDADQDLEYVDDKIGRHTAFQMKMPVEKWLEAVTAKDADIKTVEQATQEYFDSAKWF